MIYITGDIHGNRKLLEQSISHTLQPGDTIIVTGDFGVGFFGATEQEEAQFYDYMERQAYTLLFCDGNHEDFAKLNSYPEEDWNGGKVHRIRNNIIHLMRGEVYKLSGTKVFVMGGGHSYDRERR